MSLSREFNESDALIEGRPYFCLAAFPSDTRFASTQIANVSFQLHQALREPFRAQEREWAAECLLRNNGFDPNHNRGWEEAGIEDGRAGAIRLIRKAYLEAVPDFLTHMDKDMQHNSYDYTASAMAENSFQEKGFLRYAGDHLKRAHLGKDMAFLTSDAAWQEAGIESIKQFQEKVREMFVAHNVGGYALHELDPQSADLGKAKELSIQTADFAIRLSFPELADQLGIEKDIGKDLMPAKTATVAAFDRSREFRPD